MGEIRRRHERHEIVSGSDYVGVRGGKRECVGIDVAELFGDLKSKTRCPV